jgi:hypothetical protein
MAEEPNPGFSHGTGSGGNRDGAPEDAVREELGRVLASREFRSSKRSQEFLRYVVECTLGGHADSLKERTIAIDVFGRSADYDPGEDATVRVKAGEVRRRLGLYYAERGSQNPLRIELPAGTYVPEFHPVETPPPEPVPQAETVRAKPVPAAQAETPPGPRARRLHFAVAACLILVAAAAALWFQTRRRTPVLDAFWAPVLDGRSPVLLCAAFVPVYGLNRDSDPNRIQPDDFVLLNDQFVGGGDLVAVSRLSSMLTRMRRDFRLRVGNDVSFHDLRASPAILVGYSYTRWSEISSELRYFIDGDRRPVGITDNGAPTKWALPNLPPDRRTNEDYAIISRVFHPDTHAMLVEIAGITQYGTDAASDLVTNPDLLADAFRDARKGWEKMNLQLVVHVKVISGAPTPPKVVAMHFW